jgi:benzoate/toluate 1,2-dioxygenase subunit beta
MRRLISNIEILPAHDGGTEVGANFLLLESRARGLQLWGGRATYRLRRAAGPHTACAGWTARSGWRTRRSCW